MSFLCKSTASVAAIASALIFSGVAYAQAAAPVTALPNNQERANPGDSLAADADSTPGAQPVGTPLPENNDDAYVGDEGVIVVTGTAIRGVAPVGSATVDISRDTIAQSGLRSADALIAALPQGAGSASLAANNGRTASINLRGLGNNATLILFDGHRVVAQNRNQQTDPNTVPFSAVERIEVVTDGASAIYGSDAVAGVVNYILRKPFDGAEITARYTHTMYDAGAVDLVAGKTWDTGGLLVAFGAETNSRVRRYDIPALRVDQSPFGGNDLRYFGTTVNAPGAMGALIVGSTVYGLPDGLNGRTPTAGEVNPLKGNPTVYDSSKFNDFYTKRQRYSALLRVEQDLGAGNLLVTGTYTRRTNFAYGAGDGSFQNVAINIPSTSPYYITGLGGSQRIIYNFRANNPDRELNRNDHFDIGNLLVDYKMPLFADFQLSVNGAYGISEGCEVCQPQANTILTSTIAGAATASQFNPYLQGPQPSAEKLFGVFIQNSQHQLYDLQTKIDGALFPLPAGEARIAAGGEFIKTTYKHRSLYSLNPTTTLVPFRTADSDRKVYSAFGELFVPIFGSNNAMPMFQKLDLNAAVRFDHYSDVGNTTNPKFGITWKPINDLLLRGSYGTSFHAPTLSDTNFAIVGAANRTFIANNLNNPAIPVTNTATGQSLILNSSFRFTQLKPETAKIFSLGGDLTPSFIDGLKLGVTYYNVDYKDQIQSLPNANQALASAANYALYAPFFTIAPQPATCVNGSANGNPGTPEYATYNPLYLKYLNANGSYPPTTANDCQLVGILDSSTRNLGRVKQSGLDFALNYRQDISIGTVSFDGAWTKILKLKRNVLPGTPLVDALDVIGEQISSRGRASLGLRTGGFSGNLSANYIGGYLNNQTPTVGGKKLPDQNVPSWTTFDLNLSYAPDIEGGALAGTRFTINARNVTDKDPPIVLQNNVAIDTDNHSPFGRILTFEVSKEF